MCLCLCARQAEALNPELPVNVPFQTGSLLIDSESFGGKLQLWPDDTGIRTTTASLGREPSIKLPLCPDLYFIRVCAWETVCVWRLVGRWGLGSWPQADCSPRAPGVSVRERWIGLSPLANLSPETPEPSHHPRLLSHLSQNILLEGVHQPLCPSSPLSRHSSGALSEGRRGATTNLFLWVALALLMSLSHATALRGRLPPRSRWHRV